MAAPCLLWNAMHLTTELCIWIMPGQNRLQPPDLQILKMADQTEQGFFPLHLRILARSS